MENNVRTHAYLRKIGAVKEKTLIVANISWLPKFILLTKRDYYIKRNGKSCYVDTILKVIFIS